RPNFIRRACARSAPAWAARGSGRDHRLVHCWSAGSSATSVSSMCSRRSQQSRLSVGSLPCCSRLRPKGKSLRNCRLKYRYEEDLRQIEFQVRTSDAEEDANDLANFGVERMETRQSTIRTKRPGDRLTREPTRVVARKVAKR